MLVEKQLVSFFDECKGDSRLARFQSISRETKIIKKFFHSNPWLILSALLFLGSMSGAWLTDLPLEQDSGLYFGIGGTPAATTQPSISLTSTPTARATPGRPGANSTKTPHTPVPPTTANVPAPTATVEPSPPPTGPTSQPAAGKTPVVTQPVPGWPTYQQGSSGENVYSIQYMLRQRGANIDAGWRLWPDHCIRGQKFPEQ